MNQHTAAEIHVRRPQLDLSALPRYWFDGEVFATHFSNAMSSVFPPGEAFFVRAVLHYRDRITDPELLEAIRGFAGQEGQHSYIHDLHAKLIVDQGYPFIGFRNRVMKRVMPWINRHFPRFSLAITASLEHLTAILAHELLSRPERWTDRMHPDIAPLWQWHALEEVEHKAVAYDVLQQVSGSYWGRAFALVLATGMLAGETLLRLSYMLFVDGKFFDRAIWSQGMRDLFGRDGLLRPLGRPYRAWFRRDFHPWSRDDRPLIASGLKRAAAIL